MGLKQTHFSAICLRIYRKPAAELRGSGPCNSSNDYNMTIMMTSTWLTQTSEIARSDNSIVSNMTNPQLQCNHINSNGQTTVKIKQC